MAQNDFYVIMREAVTAHEADTLAKNELTPLEVEINKTKIDIDEQLEIPIEDKLIENILDRFEGMTLLAEKMIE